VIFNSCGGGDTIIGTELLWKRAPAVVLPDIEIRYVVVVVSGFNALGITNEIARVVPAITVNEVAVAVPVGPAPVVCVFIVTVMFEAVIVPLGKPLATSKTDTPGGAELGDTALLSVTVVVAACAAAQTSRSTSASAILHNDSNAVLIGCPSFASLLILYINGALNDLISGLNLDNLVPRLCCRSYRCNNSQLSR
jgi:hypothetical protein